MKKGERGGEKEEERQTREGAGKMDEMIKGDDKEGRGD